MLAASALTVVPVIAAILAPVGAYLLAVRKTSGKVATSEASELWTESRSMRDDYRDRLMVADARIVSLELRVAGLEGQNSEIVRLNIELQTKVSVLETTIAELRTLITELQATISRQKGELEEAGA